MVDDIIVTVAFVVGCLYIIALFWAHRDPHRDPPREHDDL